MFFAIFPKNIDTVKEAEEIYQANYANTESHSLIKYQTKHNVYVLATNFDMVFECLKFENDNLVDGYSIAPTKFKYCDKTFNEILENFY